MARKREDDLRFRRTEKALMEAFAQQIAIKPIERITIAELAREAMVNKSTFYLHYRDVYDLASAWAQKVADETVDQMDYIDLAHSDPAAFARKLSLQLADFANIGNRLRENRLGETFLNRLVNRTVERISAPEGLVPGSPREPYLAITFIVGGVTALITQYGATEEAIATAARLVSTMLPRTET